MKRLYNIDLLKAFSIFGVVYIHGSFLASSEHNHLNSSYFRFCVPIFIIISFYLAESYRSHDVKAFSFITHILPRLKKLFIPFFMWSCMYILLLITFPISPVKIITKHFAGYGWAGQYFFLLMIQATAAYYLIIKLRITFKALTVSCLFLFTCYLYLINLHFNDHPLIKAFDMRHIIYWIFYIVLGIWAARSTPGTGVRLAQVILLSLLLLIPGLLVIENNIMHSIGEDNQDPYLRIGVLIISTLLFLLTLTLKLHSLPLLKIIVSTISKYSMGIFCLNPLVIITLDKITHCLRPPTIMAYNTFFTLIGPFSITTFIIGVCIGLSFCIEKIGGKMLVR